MKAMKLVNMIKTVKEKRIWPGKLMLFVAVIVITTAFGGCGTDMDENSGNAEIGTTGETATDAPETLSPEMESLERLEASAEPGAEGDSVPEADTSVDVDLTALSSTMVYSEVYNMVMSPDSYKGKTVKMKGVFSYYYSEDTNKDYYACIISDATACCSQGIEFELGGGAVYPDDYPEPDGECTVVGVFDTYAEEDTTYCVLREAELAN